jgi:hypothetical protein
MHAAIDTIDDDVLPIGDFIDQTDSHHFARKRRMAAAGLEDSQTRGRTLDAGFLQRPLHRLKGVGALAQPTEFWFELGVDRPDASPPLDSKSKTFQLLEAADTHRLPDWVFSLSSADNDNAVLAAAQKHAIDVRESLPLDLIQELGSPLELRLRPKLECYERLCAGAYAISDIIASDDEILPALVATANDNMAMGMACIEVIDRNPIEFAAEILFQVAHQIADERL